MATRNPFDQEHDLPASPFDASPFDRDPRDNDIPPLDDLDEMLAVWPDDPQHLPAPPLGPHPDPRDEDVPPPDDQPTSPFSDVDEYAAQIQEENSHLYPNGSSPDEIQASKDLYERVHDEGSPPVENLDALPAKNLDPTYDLFPGTNDYILDPQGKRERPIFDTRARWSPNRAQYAAWVRDGQHPGLPKIDNITAVIRAHKAKHGKDHEYDMLKAQLPMIIRSNRTLDPKRERAKIHALRHGFVHNRETVHEWDGLTEDQREAVFSVLANISWITDVARSAGGDLYAVARHGWTPKNEAEHHLAFEHADDLLVKLTGQTTDPAPKGLRSTRYVAHDPGILSKAETEIEPLARPEQSPPTQQHALPPQRRQQNTDKAEHNLARLQDAQRFVPCSRFSEPDWKKLGWSYHAAEAGGDIPPGTGLHLWRDYSATDPARFHDGECEREWARFKPQGGNTIATAFYLFQQLGWKWPAQHRQKPRTNTRPASRNGTQPDSGWSAPDESSDQRDEEGRLFVPKIRSSSIHRMFRDAKIYPVRDEGDPTTLFYTETPDPVTWTDVQQGKVRPQDPHVCEFLYDLQSEHYAHQISRGDEMISVPANFPLQRFRSANVSLASQRKINRLQLYFEQLPPWDGRERIATIVDRCFELVDDDHAHAVAAWVGRYLFVGTVIRSFHPGFPMHRMPVLIGSRGIGKSSLVEYVPPLRSMHTSSVRPTAEPRELIETTAGFSIVELDELEKMRTCDVGKFKTFLSRDKETARPAYAHYSITVPRPFLLVGTANAASEGIFPFDESEALARRVAIVEVDFKIPPAEIRQLVENDRPQLYAEALVIYKMLLEVDTDALEALRAYMEMSESLHAWNDSLFRQLQVQDETAHGIAQRIKKMYTDPNPPEAATLDELLYGFGFIHDSTEGRRKAERHADTPPQPAAVPPHLQHKLTDPAYLRFRQSVGSQLSQIGVQKIRGYRNGVRVWLRC